MRVEQVAFPIMRQIGQRPKLAKSLFRFSRWGSPFTPERYSNPYPLLETMQDDGPVTYHRTYRMWFVFGYEEAHEVLRSTQTSVSGPIEMLFSIRPYNKLSAPSKSDLAHWLLLVDPPDAVTTHGSTRRKAVTTYASTRTRRGHYAVHRSRNGHRLDCWPERRARSTVPHHAARLADAGAGARWSPHSSSPECRAPFRICRWTTSW